MTQIVFSCTNCGALYRAVQEQRKLSISPRSFKCAECNAPVHSWEGQFNYLHCRRFVPTMRMTSDLTTSILTDQSEAVDAAEAFRLLVAFRLIRDRAIRFRLIEKAEAMAADKQAGRETAKLN
ncbi:MULTISPECIES: hypothetical protein [Bradyrhizobium]|uniref:hypothetical protein n=1 Tax=Bradyrhizobium sp. 8-10B TaxID=3344579 RepID=UPI0035BFBA2A